MDWSGFYAGVQGGFATGSAAIPYGNTSGGPYTDTQDDAGQSGIFGGVHVGAQTQMDGVVVGLEADVELSGVNGDDGGDAGDINGLENNWQGSLRGRLGYAMDSVMVYGTAGLAYLDATATAPGETDNVDFFGWTVGAGVEAMFTEDVSARVEYRYTDFGSSEAAFPGNGYYEDVNPRQHSVRFGVSYHFN